MNQEPNQPPPQPRKWSDLPAGTFPDTPSPGPGWTWSGPNGLPPRWLPPVEALPEPPQPELKPGDVGIWTSPCGLRQELRLLHGYSTPPYLPVESCWHKRSMIKPGEVQWHRRLALVSDKQEVCGWQPIETAPKDGTSILAVHSEGRHISAISYSDGCWRLDLWGSYITKPTHWMPLPPSPGCETKPNVCGWFICPNTDRFKTESCAEGPISSQWKPNFCPGCGRRIEVKGGGE